MPGRQMPRRQSIRTGIHMPAHQEVVGSFRFSGQRAGRGAAKCGEVPSGAAIVVQSR